MADFGLADLHTHTDFSDGWPTPEELIRYASAETDLDVIAVTDHDTIEGALRAQEVAGKLGRALHVVVGEEVSSRDGHILGLFLQRRVKPGASASATVEMIHAQGGIAIAAHPFWRTDRQVRSGTVHGVGWGAGEADFDGLEVENSTPGFYIFNQMARRLNEALQVAEVGSSDGHILDAVGRACTVFPGRTPAELRRAFQNRSTVARRERYRAIGLVRYMAWGFNHTKAGAGAAVGI